MALPQKTVPLVRVSAAIASRQQDRLDQALRDALGSDQDAVEEVLLQAHLFVGFPVALEALIRWRELCGRPPSAPLDEDPALWAGRGAAVCERVYGANYPKLRANLQAIHPDFDRWMLEGGYGRVVGRPRLDLTTRELCIAALLTVWHAPRQLHSHLRGALNAGADADDLEEALELAAQYASPPAANLARDLLARILNR